MSSLLILVLLLVLVFHLHSTSHPKPSILFIGDSNDRNLIVNVCDEFHGRGSNFGGSDFISRTGLQRHSWDSTDHRGPSRFILFTNTSRVWKETQTHSEQTLGFHCKENVHDRYRRDDGAASILLRWAHGSRDVQHIFQSMAESTCGSGIHEVREKVRVGQIY